MKNKTDDEDRDQRRLAFLLLRKASERKFTPIGREEATQLLGQVEHVYMGMGSSNLLIPVSAMQAAGIDTETWRKADFSEKPRKGEQCFEVPADFADRGLIPVLKILSQGVEAEMAEISKRHGAPDKPKGR